MDYLVPQVCWLVQQQSCLGRSVHEVWLLETGLDFGDARIFHSHEILWRMVSDRRRMHSLGFGLQWCGPKNEQSTLESFTKCKPMGHRVSTKLARLSRKLEHEHQSLATKLYVSEGDPQGQEAGLSRQSGYIRNQRFLARLLPRVLPYIRSRSLSSNYC